MHYWSFLFDDYWCFLIDAWWLFSPDANKILLCWASKTKKFKHCVPKCMQKKFQNYYLIYLHKLRFLGINYLRKQFKILDNAIKGDKRHENKKYNF